METIRQIISSPHVTQALAVLGSLTAASYALKLLSFIKLHAFHRSTLHRYRLRSEASTWALVTGSTNGIGKGLAYEIAANGFNVVLHGRNEAKLNAIKADLERVHPSQQFRILVLDASNSHGMKQAIERAAAAMHELPGKLRVLVNNCGGPGPLETPFNLLEDHPSAAVDSIINLNVRFGTQLTRALLPLLRSNGPSLILVSGSIAGVWPSPWISVYAGSKAFNNAWGVSLARELREDKIGIECMTSVIAQVSETGTQTAKPTFFAPNGRTEARSILSKVGCGYDLVIAHWPHAMQIGLVGLLPDALVSWIVVMSTRQGRADYVKAT